MRNELIRYVDEAGAEVGVTWRRRPSVGDPYRRGGRAYIVRAVADGRTATGSPRVTARVVQVPAPPRAMTARAEAEGEGR